MRVIGLIAFNTFRQTLRQRLYYNVAIFGVGMLILSMVMGNITFGYPDRVVRSIGLSGVCISLDLIALLVGVGLIHEEIDKKTLFVVLARPVGRVRYVAGRYLGLVSALGLALFGLTGVYFLTLTAAGGSITWPDVVAVAAALPEAMLLGGIGLVLSAFSTPTLSSGIGFGLWIAAATSDDLVRLTAKAEPSVRALTTAVYYALPSLERLNFRQAAIYGQHLGVWEVVGALSYGAVYSVFLVALASLILSRREMI
ncbi:MAG: ABC transporter permease [Deltaproteobacteria bacterium]|nr:ABC transporter permease [Deltaproteobacteria bacterium]